VTAVAWDVKSRRIPNFVTVSAAAIGLALWVVQSGWQGLGESLAGLGTGFGIFLVPFMMGGLGAGDVKLAAAVGAVMGARFALETCLYGALAGGLISSYHLLRTGRLVTTLRTVLWNVIAVFAPRLPFTPLPKLTDARENAGEQASESVSSKAFPYGVAIALGSLIAAVLG
jgi:prepilin peptidase CpaA